MWDGVPQRRKYNMRVSLKAVLRQPVRTFVFILLVGLASFGFVSRLVEYTILSREMNRIEAFYRTMGTLVSVDPYSHNNVYHAVQLLQNSPHIAVHDDRVIVQGVMDGIPNAMHEFFTRGGNELVRGVPAFGAWGLHPLDTIAIIEIGRVHRRQVRITGEAGFWYTTSVSFNVVENLFGHNQFLPGRRIYQAEFPFEDYGSEFFDNLVQGNRYIIRATSFDTNHITAHVFPLYNDVYFVDIYDEIAMAEMWENIGNDLQILQENTNMLMVTGTRDMTALPFVQSGVYERFQGRFINYEDYLNANHVMVVPQAIDGRRAAARVGQTVTLTLRNMRTFEEGAQVTATGLELQPQVAALWRNLPAGYWVGIPNDYEGWQSYETITIEVEVVGTYVVPASWHLPRWNPLRGTYDTMEVFVPASIIPEGWGIVDSHIVTGAYSFTLTSPDVIDSFMADYRAVLASYGFNIQLFGPDATNFLLSATPIRNSIRLNLVLFTLVLLLVLVLTVFIYLRQRYKEFAIMRALGNPATNSIWQVMLPVLIFWIPIMLVASFGAWHFALNQATVGMQVLAGLDIPLDQSVHIRVMNILDQMRHDAEVLVIRATPRLDITYLVWMCIILVVSWVAIVFVGVLAFSRKSMVSLLQGTQGSAPTRTIKEVAPPENIQLIALGSVLAIGTETVKTAGNRLKSSLRHHRRHITRALVKTVLVVALALLFVVSLSWLNRTIVFTEAEIERPYATTRITGEIYDPAGYNWLDGYGIPNDRYTWLDESEFINNIFATSYIQLLFTSQRPEYMIPLWNEDNPDENEIWTIHNSLIMSITDWDTFVEANNVPIAFGVGWNVDEFAVEFAPGFSHEDIFMHSDAEELDFQVARFPVIVHENLLTRGRWFDGDVLITDTVSLGDYAYISHANFTIPVHIIGVYRGGHPTSAMRAGQGTVVINAVFTRLATLGFEVRQDMIPYLEEFVEDMNARLTGQVHHEIEDPWQFGPRFWTEQFTHQIRLNDSEFRLVVVPLKDNLHLLRILYPVAITMSFVIALGLSLLLIIQNAKNVAILRVLGMAKSKTRFNLFMEQMVVCTVGIVFGIIVAIILGVTITSIGYLAGVYFAGAVVGTLVGVYVISIKTPLELLQVRE